MLPLPCPTSPSECWCSPSPAPLALVSVDAPSPSPLALVSVERCWTLCTQMQWRNRRGSGGGRVPPETSEREIFADVSGKKGKEVKIWEEKKRENCKREGGKLEMEVGKVIERGEELFFFFFFAFYFWKRWRKFVLGLPKWEFSTGKKHFTPGKNQEKWLCPLRKICLLRPWPNALRFSRHVIHAREA